MGRVFPRSITCAADRLAAAAPILAGLGAGLAYVDDRLVLLPWIALALLAWSWLRTGSTSSLLADFLGGVAYHALALGWLRQCYADGQQWFGPKFGAWVVISIMGGAAFAMMCHYGRYLLRQLRFPAAAALPLAWVTMEIGKAGCGLVFSQTPFPWAKLGLTQAPLLTFAQVADLGGELFLSALVCLAAGALADAAFVAGLTEAGGPSLDFASRRRHGMAACTAAIALVSAWTYGTWRLHQPLGRPGPLVCLMGQLDLPPLLQRQRVPEQVDESGSHRPDLLLWPELAWHHKLVELPGESKQDAVLAKPPDLVQVCPGNLSGYRQFVDRSLLASAAEVDAVLVLGCERFVANRSDWRRFNSVVCVDPHGNSIRHYDKRWLVPWGEFVPYRLFDSSASDAAYQHGAVREPFQITTAGTTYRYRLSICYDLCFAAQFWPVVGDREACPVDFFLHCGSEGQDPTGALAAVLRKAAQLRAIESRRAIVRNVNFGYSGLIDGNGVVRWETARAPIRAPQPLPPVPIDGRTSVYARCGDWPLTGLCAGIALIGLARRRRSR